LVRESMDVHEHLENDLMPLFHGGNRGSNPLGDASYLCNLRSKAVIGVPVVSRLAHLEERIKHRPSPTAAVYSDAAVLSSASSASTISSMS